MAQKGLAVLAVLALLSLTVTGCIPAFQQLIGMDRGGVHQDEQVLAQGGDSGDESEDTAQVEQLQGREKSKAVWGAFRDEEVRELGRLLRQQGLRLNLREAQAYEVTSTEKSEAEAAALGMEVTGDEGKETGTLVDVPLGDSGHLLQVSNEDADHTWAEIEGEDGELTYIDLEEEAHFIIPDEETEQELLEALEQDPAYQELLTELEAQGASIADVQVVIDEDTGEAHFLVEAAHGEGAQGEWFGAGFRKPRIAGTYSLHFPVKRVDGPRRFQPVSPATRRPVRELLEDRRSRARLAVLYGGRRHDTSRLKRAVFWHEFIRHTKLAVDATKVWLGDMEDKRAFGKPDDPFTYKIRLKRAPWLKTELQLELMDGCDSGDWVPKLTQVVLPGQVEVAWKLAMAEWADAGLGYKGKSCKFRVRDLRSGRILGPWDGPEVFDPVAWKEWYQEQWTNGGIYHAVAEPYNALPDIQPKALFIPGTNLLLYGFRNLDQDRIQQFVKVTQQLSENHPWEVFDLEMGSAGGEVGEEVTQDMLDQFFAAIEELASYLASHPDATDEEIKEEIERLKEEYEGFANFIDHLDLPVIGFNEEQILELLKGMAELASDEEIWQDFKETLLALLEALQSLPQAELDIPGIGTVMVWRKLEVNDITRLSVLVKSLLNDFGREETISFLRDLANLVNELLTNPNYTVEQKEYLLVNLLNKLPGTFSFHRREENQEFMAEVGTALQVLHTNNWKLVNFGLTISGFGGREKIDLIVTGRVEGASGPITAFVQVYTPNDQGKIDTKRIVKEVERTANYAAAHVGEKDPGTQIEYEGRPIVVVVIDGPTSSSEIERLKRKLERKELDVPAVIIYQDEHGVWHTEGIGCPSDIDPDKVAESMGYDVNSPNSSIDDPPDGSIVIAPPPLNPDGSICTKSPCILSRPISVEDY